MKGYKGFNKDLTCRDFKYEIGKTYEMKEKPMVCERGFHFCKELEDAFGYYYLYKNHTFCEIEAYGDTITDDDGKYCTNKIKIIKELSLDEILNILGIKDKETFIRCYNDDRFKEDQIDLIRVGLEKGLDVSMYAKPEFNIYQMCYIYYGLKESLDVSIYAKPEFDKDQIWCIYRGLEKGLDVNIYAKPEFSWKQMRVIYYGLEDGLDVSIYAKPEFDYEQMHKMYLKLVEEKTNE